MSDKRYQVPTLKFVVARDDLRATELAAKMLAEDANHRCVEVWSGGELLFSLPECCLREAPEPPA